MVKSMRGIWKPVSMALLVLCATNVAADELEYVVKGVEDPLKANVLSHLEQIQIGRDARLADRDYAEVIANAEKRARTALRPFGYYRPDVRGRVQRRSDDTLRLTISINAGPPMIVTAVEVQVVGAGANREELRKWRPGVNSKDIDVTLEDGVLSIKGSRNTEKEVSAAGYRRRERTNGTFLRQFTLPDTVDANSISASARDGVLEVTIPKQEKPAAKKIAVN